MNLQEMIPYEEQAIDAVVSVINRAKEKIGVRQTLRELAKSRDVLESQAKVAVTKLRTPLPITSKLLIEEMIEKNWGLTDTLMYTLKNMGGSQDECSQYYYFEAIFSQPTIQYPIPQATVSVFFRVENKHLEPPETLRGPLMTFRIEGQSVDHDVRFVTLTADWILAVLKMKIKFFKRIEKIRLF